MFDFVEFTDRYRTLESYDRNEFQKILAFTAASLTGLSFLLWYGVTVNENYLVATNSFLLPVYFAVVYLAVQFQFGKALLCLAVSNLFLIVFNTLFLGTASGIHLLLWPLGCILAMDTYIKMNVARQYAIFAIIVFATLQSFAPSFTQLEFYEASRSILLFIAGSALALAMTSLSTSVSRRQKKLQKMANRDNLTTLYNRRYFSSFLNYQMAVSFREKRSFSLVMADIDHFKNINDNFGHDVGDKVLKAVSDCFLQYLAQHDLACRWGGEEFLIYLPESNVDDAERVVQAIASVLSDIQVDSVNLTLSFGLVDSDGNESLDELLQRVDVLLYQAKANGRNNIQKSLA